MKQLELGLGLEIPVQTKVEQPNPMVHIHGCSTTESATCKTCKHLYKKEFTGTYYKCGLFGDTNGSATDFRLKWNACRHYVESQEVKTTRKRKQKNKEYQLTKSLINSITK